MNVTEFILTFEKARKKWDALLRAFQIEDFEKIGVIAEMSLKNLVAHMSWYEMEMVELLSTRALAGSDLWGLKDDERNQAIYEMNKGRGIEEVLEESAQVYSKLHKELSALTDDQLSNPGAFEGMPDDWVPWKVIAGNSFNHYQQHFDDLETWHSAIYN
jgi:hypothetical protein